MHSHDTSPRSRDWPATVYGEDDQRPPLVLLHGLTYDRRLWGPALHELRTVDPGRRVLNLDLPGHGASPRRDATGGRVGPAHPRRGPGRRAATPVLVGHSAGGVLATIYASRYPTSGVINVDQPLLTPGFAQLLRAHEATLRGPGYAAVWDMMAASMHTDLLPPDAQQLLRTISDPRQDLLLGYWDEVLTTPPDELTDRIRGAGRSTRNRSALPQRLRADPERRVPELAGRLLPDAVNTVLPGSGHFPQLAHPSRFARVLALTGRWPE